jgi:2-methylisocitrate lyase-like PEP mutase family enzyme
MPQKPTWNELLAGVKPLLLPCAHDALSARLIERAGFSAYSTAAMRWSVRAMHCRTSDSWALAR